MDDGPEPIGVEESSEFAYAEARRILSEARSDALLRYQAEAAKRRRVAIGALVAWCAIAAILCVAISPDMLVVGEIGLAIVIGFSVFYLLPSIVGKGNLVEAFDQYEGQIDKLETSFAPLPVVASVEELADALAVIAVPEHVE